jgi:hypothetical protein
VFRYFELIWGSSKDFWQSKWQAIHDFVDGDEVALSIYGRFMKLV